MPKAKNRRHVRVFAMLCDNHLVGIWLVYIKLRAGIRACGQNFGYVAGFG